jgi:hypothetical protein
MRTRTDISGRYRIVNEALLREKASREDKRHIFYSAMFASQTYEEYLSKVGQEEVCVASYKSGPINGRMEILYCRRRGWIVDA